MVAVKKLKNKGVAHQFLRIVDGVRHKLAPGMQVTAEIKLGIRTILEYLPSPVMSAFQEAARER